MWWWVLGQLPFLPFDLGLLSLKVSSERKVYVCNHAFYFFKFHGILPQQVSITSTFDPHVGTLVIVRGLSQVFFHDHRFASVSTAGYVCFQCSLCLLLSVSYLQWGSASLPWLRLTALLPFPFLPFCRSLFSTLLSSEVPPTHGESNFHADGPKFRKLFRQDGIHLYFAMILRLSRRLFDDIEPSPTVWQVWTQDALFSPLSL